MREPFRKVKVYLNILMSMEVIIGCAILMTTFFYQSFVCKYVAVIQRKVFSGPFFNSYIFGFQLVFGHMVGLNLWQKLWNCKYSTIIEMLLCALMFLNVLIVLSGVGVIWSLYRCSEAFYNMAEMSMREGMDMYFDSPEWKLLWDGLQYHKQCCGIRGYKDWMNASWMKTFKSYQHKEKNDNDNDSDSDNDLFQTNEDLIDYIEAKSREASIWNSTIYAPYTCCKESSSICFESFNPQIATEMKIPTLTVSEINTRGCLPPFSDAMCDLLKILTFLTCLSFICNIIICFITKTVLRHQVCISPDSTNMRFIDDEGRTVVYLRYPPNISCVTLNESIVKKECCDSSPAKPNISDYSRCANCGKVKQPNYVQGFNQCVSNNSGCAKCYSPRILH